MRALCLLLAVCLFTTSSPAAPRVLTGLAAELAPDASYVFHTKLLSALQQVLNRPASAKQEKQKDRDARVGRIEISPGDVTLQAGQRMIFAATAFDGAGEPVGGVHIKWKAKEIGGGKKNKHISHTGEFLSPVAGEFTVSAEAAGARAEVTVRVVNETNSQRPHTGEPLEGEQPLSTKEVSTRDESPEQAAAKRKAGRDRASRRAARGRSGEVSFVKASHAPEAAPAAAAPAAPAVLYEYEWNDTNYTSADDPGNLRGDAPGAPADGGAGSGNFQLGAPVLDLAGRGIDLKLNLVYNSQVWSKSGSQITHDIDQDWPAAGWSLGFGRLVKMGTSGSMLVDADGTRHSYTGTLNNYSWGSVFSGYTTDSTFVNYTHSTNSNGVITSASASYPNGTVVYYGAPGRNAVYPTQITDANGNYIVITYRNNAGPHIQTITDTLGRTINFHYDANSLLTAVTAPGMGGTTRTLVRLHYRWLTLGYYFYGVTPQVRSQTVPVVDAIYYPATRTGFWFGDADSYSSYGMIAKVQEQRAMSHSAASLNDQGVVSPGPMTSQRLYNYPLSTGAGYQTGPPAYTTQTETWDGMDTAPAVTTYSVQQNSNPRSVSITQPDGTRSVQYSYNAPNTWYDGLTYQDEIYDSAGRLWRRSTVSWQQGAYGSVRPVRNETLDEAGQVTAEEFSYGAQYNQVTEVRAYGFGGYTLLRRTVSEYDNSAAYINRHIFSLVKNVSVYGPDGTRIARTDFEYDGPGANLQAAPGVTMHYASHNPHAPAVWVEEQCRTQCPPTGGYPQYQYDIDRCEWVCDPGYWQTPYYSATDYRGNVTRVTKYADAANLTGPSVETRAYDVTGNLVKTSTSCCEETRNVYGADTQYGYPTSQRRGAADPNSAVRVTTNITYDFGTGVPLSSTDANGRVSSTEFAADSLRPSAMRLPTGAYTTFVYDDTQTGVTETVYHAGGAVASANVKKFNGRGQVTQERALAPGGAWDIVSTTYDQLGRVWKQSNPYRSGQTAYWTENFYDALGRATKAVGADGSVVETLFNEQGRPPGASAEAGSTRRSIDAWGRERWERTDATGRVVEVAEPNPGGSGSVMTAGAMLTRYRYDALGNLAEVTQGSQTRRFRHDALGRLTHQKLAEAGATLNDAGQYVGAGTWSHVFAYDDRSNLAWQVDARGVRTTYAYNGDPLNRLQSISYSTAGVGDASSPVEAAPTISYQYAAAGDLMRLARVTAAGVSTEDFAYDAEGRPARKTLTLASRPSHPMVLEYTYNTLGKLTDVRYPTQYGAGNATKYLHYDYDAAGRLSALKVNGVDYGSQMAYNAGNQMTSLLVGSAGASQVTETYGYSEQTGLMSGQRIVRNGAALLDLSYDYYGTGARAGRTGQIKRITNNLAGSKSRTFDYDALGRLVKATNGSTWQERYTYDRYGNRTSVSSLAGIAAAPSTKPAGVELAYGAAPQDLPDFLRAGESRSVSDAAPLSPLALARAPQAPLPGLKDAAGDSPNAAPAPAEPVQTQTPTPTPTPTPAKLVVKGAPTNGATTSAICPVQPYAANATNAIGDGCGEQNYPPWAEPGGPYTGQPNQPIQFNGTGSYDGDGWITNYNWNFGDGTTSTLASPSKTYAAPGTYNVTLRVRDNSFLWSQYNYTTATVTNPTPVNNAAFVSQSVPTAMNAGQQYTVSVTMNNNGTKTWTAADQHRLGSQNAQDNTTWGLSRVNLPATVAPGQNATFTFTVTAPSSPGTYNFQWRMVQDGVAWFGGATANVAVTVTQPAVGGCSGPAPCDGHPTISYDPASNRINSPGWLYDAAGNQIRAQRADGSWQRYVYDAAGRLATVRNDAGAVLLSYRYGATNQRLITQEGGSASNLRTYHVWEGNSIAAEFGESNSSPTAPVWNKNYIYLAARLLATQEPSTGSETVFFHHPDHLGSRLVTNQINGTVVEQANLPFGNAMLSESLGGTARRFTSYTRDATSGLDNAVNRQYDPLQGRFTQVDPIGMKAVNASDPQTLNLYAYCGNDPVNGTDPDGLFFGKLFKGIGKLFKGIVKVIGKIVSAVGRVLSAVGTVMAKILHNRWVMIGVSILSLVFPPLMAIYQTLSEVASVLQITGLLLQGKWKELVHTVIQAAVQWALNKVMDFIVSKIQTLIGTLKVLPDCAIKALGGFFKGLNLADVRIYTGLPWLFNWGGGNVDAFTYGRNIYFSGNNYDPRTRGGLSLIGHELVHVVDYIRLLHPVRFVVEYLGGWAGANFDYRTNPFEARAYKMGNPGGRTPGTLDTAPGLDTACAGL